MIFDPISRFLNQLPPSSRGAVLLVTGISVFGFTDNLTLGVSDMVGVGQFHFSRSVIAVVFVFIMGRLFRLSVMPGNLKAVAVRTLFIMMSMLLYFSVLPMMPIAEAGAGLFTSPIFVLLFSILLFRERVGWRRILAVAAGSAGVLLVLKPGAEGFSIYHLLPVLAGASYAIGSICTWRYCRDESPLALLMCFLIAIGGAGWLYTSLLTAFPAGQALLTEAPFLFRGWQEVDMRFWVWMVFIALGASVALSMMTRAYQLTQTSYATIYEYAYLLSAGLFSWIFWGIVPGVMSFFGIALIIIAGVVITIAQMDKGAQTDQSN